MGQLAAREETEMRVLFLGLLCSTLCVAASCANDETYWLQIERLLQKDAGEGNPELVKYLTSLTKDQTLSALRQFGEVVERKTPVESWPQMGPTVASIMQCYPETPHVSATDSADLSERERRNYRDRDVPGPVSSEAFDKLVSGIREEAERDFFRFALASYASSSDAAPDLTKIQKTQLFETCLAVVSAGQSPEVVRRECCDGAMRVLGREYRSIIYADDAVKQLMRTGTPEQRHNLNALLSSGEIK